MMDLSVVCGGSTSFEIACCEFLEDGWIPKYNTFRVDNETCYMIFVKEEKESNDDMWEV